MTTVLAPHLQVRFAPQVRGTFYILGYPVAFIPGLEVVMAGAARFPWRRSKPAITHLPLSVSTLNTCEARALQRQDPRGTRLAGADPDSVTKTAAQEDKS
jgi:hypothetical protein